MKKDQKYLTISELAKMLGISRQAVLKKIKNNQIKADKIGKFYVIPKDSWSDLIHGDLSDKLKDDINKGVSKVIKEYGETLKLLGKE